MGTWTLTIRHGSEVAHESFDGLEEAVDEMRRRALEIRAEGPLNKASMLRGFEPAEQLHARLQVSAKGPLLRRPTAGVDVRGDGTFIPFRGGLRRKELRPGGNRTPFDAVREALEAEAG